MATGCYVEPYLPASFRGVPFTALETTSEHGRRVAEGEFAFSENTATNDMGIRLRRYTIRARFADNNHVTQVALLIAAVEARGAGVLVHPTRGVVDATCTRAKVTDNPEEEQGVTYVDLEFVESNQQTNGVQLANSIITLALGSIIGQSRSNFTSTYNPEAVQTFREDAVVAEAQGVVGNVANLYAEATVANATDERNEILLELQSIATDPNAARVPENVARAVAVGMSQTVKDLEPSAQYQTARELANATAVPVVFGGAAQQSVEATYSLARVVSAAYMAEASLLATDFNADEVFGQVDAVDSILSSEIEYARNQRDNQLHQALVSFRNESLNAMSRRAFDLPGVIQFNFAGTVHPLVAAYALYDDAKQSRRIEQLNTVNALGRVGPEVLGERVFG